MIEVHEIKSSDLLKLALSLRNFFEERVGHMLSNSICEFAGRLAELHDRATVTKDFDLLFEACAHMADGDSPSVSEMENYEGFRQRVNKAISGPVFVSTTYGIVLMLGRYDRPQIREQLHSLARVWCDVHELAKSESGRKEHPPS